jgi:hypothetical protein
MTMTRALLVTLLVSVCACEDRRRSSEDGGAAREDGSRSGEGGGPARFRVVNQGSVRVYLQVWGGSGFWLLSRGGQLLQAGESCGICNCSDDPCLVCGPGGRIGQVVPIDPGASYSWDWDGQIWKRGDQVNGQVCERPELLSSGPLKLSVEYGTQIKELVGGAELVGPPISTSVDFDHAPDITVEVAIR